MEKCTKNCNNTFHIKSMPRWNVHIYSTLPVTLSLFPTAVLTAAVGAAQLVVVAEIWWTTSFLFSLPYTVTPAPIQICTIGALMIADTLTLVRIKLVIRRTLAIAWTFSRYACTLVIIKAVVSRALAVTDTLAVVQIQLVVWWTLAAAIAWTFIIIQAVVLRTFMSTYAFAAVPIVIGRTLTSGVAAVFALSSIAIFIGCFRNLLEIMSIHIGRWKKGLTQIQQKTAKTITTACIVPAILHCTSKSFVYSYTSEHEMHSLLACCFLYCTRIHGGLCQIIHVQELNINRFTHVYIWFLIR